jgi:hypothetical protein
MNFKLYNYLKLMGVSAEIATAIASDPNVSFDIDIYEQKPVVDRNRRGGFARVIGLKDCFKSVSRS